MAARLNPRSSRNLAIGLLLAVVLALAAAMAIPVWMAHRHYDSALEGMVGKLERDRRIAAMRPELARQLEAMRGKEARRFFLRSGGTALSAAEAQEAVRTIIESNGGRLITMQAPNARDDGRYRQITINVQMSANIVALRRILHAIETNTPLLFVDTLTVRSQVPGNFKPAPGAEPEMFVQFDVSGYAFTGT